MARSPGTERGQQVARDYQHRPHIDVCVVRRNYDSESSSGLQYAQPV